MSQSAIISPDQPGALRQRKNSFGVVLETRISWMPPSVDLPAKSCRCLIILQDLPNEIAEGFWSASRQQFGIYRGGGKFLDLKAIAHYAPSTVNQQPNQE